MGFYITLVVVSVCSTFYTFKPVIDILEQRRREREMNAALSALNNSTESAHKP